MDRVETLSVTLPAEMAQMIRDKVRQGQFTSSSELIQEAVAALQEQPLEMARRLDSLRARIAEADADPRPSLSEAEVDRHFAGRASR